MTGKTHEQRKAEDRARILEAINNGVETLPVMYRAKNGKHGKVFFYIEACEIPQNGGSTMKLYGTRQRWKGVPIAEYQDYMDMLKLGGFYGPYILARKSPAFCALIGTLFLFRKRKFWALAYSYARTLRRRASGHITIAGKRYNGPERELLRAGKEANRKHEERHGGNGRNVRRVFTRGVEFLCFALHLDSVYRFRFQDWMGAWDKRMSARANLANIARIAQGREMQNNQLGKKNAWALRALVTAMTFDRHLRELTETFFSELRTDRCVLDDDDRYFAYQTGLYRYDGLAPEELRKEFERMDREAGNTSLDIAREARGEVSGDEESRQKVGGIDDKVLEE